MKLNEISTDKALDILCNLALPITTIAEDKELIKAIYKRTIVTKETSQEDKKVLGTMQVAKNCKTLIPGLFKTHRNEVYEILSIINEKDVEEIKKQNAVETFNQLKELLQDKELTSFFSSQLNLKKKQSSISTSSTKTVV